MDFVQWIKSTELSSKSAGSYAGAINGCLAEWARTGGLTPKEIVQITDVVEFEALVAGLRQMKVYQERNTTGHGMYSAALKVYRRYLDEVRPGDALIPDEHGPYQKQVSEIAFNANESFDPNDQTDARQRVLREVVRRRGQSKFRQSLIATYGGRCAITDCPVISLLEAAHITPYLGPDTNSISNGLLLRADLHTLWDLGLLALEPVKQTVWVSPQVNDPSYQVLSGTLLRKPIHQHHRPSIHALKQQWDHAHSKYSD